MQRVYRSLVVILIAQALVAPAYAACSSELLAVAAFGFERIPGDQMAHQIYQARKNQANAALSACQDAERTARRVAQQQEAEARFMATQRAAAAADEKAQQLSSQLADLRTQMEQERIVGAISQAVLQGRCDDAKFIALNRRRLDLADQASRLCTKSAANRAAPNSPASPIDSGSWIRQGDYPQAALQEKRVGRAVVAFDISEEGLIENCSTEQSSGYADLDEAACMALYYRGLYAPATNEKGARMRTRKSQAVNWTLNP